MPYGCQSVAVGLSGFCPPSLSHCKAPLTHYFCHLDMSARLCSQLCGVDRSQGRLSVLISWTSSGLIGAAGVMASHFEHSEFTCAWSHLSSHESLTHSIHACLKCRKGLANIVFCGAGAGVHAGLLHQGSGLSLHNVRHAQCMCV